MSRTYRNRPACFAKGSQIWERNRKYAEEEGQDFTRNGLFNPYDRAGLGKVYQPFNNAPKGFSNWETVGLSSRRIAKRATAKILRNRAKQEINNELREDLPE